VHGFVPQIDAEPKSLTLALYLTRLIGLHEIAPITEPTGQPDGKIADTPGAGVDDNALNPAEPPVVGAQHIQFGEDAGWAGDLGGIKVGKS
jgi:hypothetical protein